MWSGWRRDVTGERMDEGDQWIRRQNIGTTARTPNTTFRWTIDTPPPIPFPLHSPSLLIMPTR